MEGTEEKSETPELETEPPLEEGAPPEPESEPPPEEPEPPPEEPKPPPEEPKPPPEEPPPEEPPPEEPKPSPEEPKPIEETNPIEEALSHAASREPSVNAAKKSASALKSSIKSEINNLAEKVIQKREPSIPGLRTPGNFNCSTFLHKRSPFIHNPPQPEERRARIANPRTPREYIINLREDLADFQESHGLPRTRDYSFISLGLALAQETARALCSLFLMFAELFPIVAIVSLLMRFALDKLIEILETPEPVTKVKKSIIFAVEILVIIIPLWILIGTIILPLLSLILSIFKRMVRIKGRGRRHSPKSKSCAADGFRFFY